jgi:phosphoglycolate phosphatase
MADAPTRPVLVLWDIDHTLLETRGLGAELYRHAFERATGRHVEQAAEVTGQTETSILIATLRLHGLTQDEPYLSRYVEALADEYEQHREELKTRGRLLPGARDVLAALAAEPGIDGRAWPRLGGPAVHWRCGQSFCTNFTAERESEQR